MAELLEYPKGIKWTKQRKDVYDTLNKAREPLSAVQIYSRIEKESDEAEYALSTIYRILQCFEENDIVSKTTWMGDGTVVYELNRGEHTHYAVCINCHKRIPLEGCPFNDMHVHDIPNGFVITGHKLEIYGYCKACKSALNR